MGLLFYEIIFVKTQEYLEDENENLEGSEEDEEDADSIDEPSKNKNL